MATRGVAASIPPSPAPAPAPAPIAPFTGPINGPATVTGNPVAVRGPQVPIDPATIGQGPAIVNEIPPSIQASIDARAAAAAPVIEQPSQIAGGVAPIAQAAGASPFSMLGEGRGVREGNMTNRRNPRLSQSLTPDQLKRAAASRLGL